MKRDGWHAWAYSLRRNSNSLCYLGLYEHLCWIFPCSLSRNWVVVLSSTSKAGSMIQSRTHPRWMHTYACNFWVIPTLASFQKIQSQCSAVDLSLVLWSNWEWLGQRSAHIWKWGVSADANLMDSMRHNDKDNHFCMWWLMSVQGRITNQGRSTSALRQDTSFIESYPAYVDEVVSKWSWSLCDELDVGQKYSGTNGKQWSRCLEATNGQCRCRREPLCLCHDSGERWIDRQGIDKLGQQWNWPMLRFHEEHEVGLVKMRIKPSGARKMSDHVSMLMPRGYVHSLWSLNFQIWSKPEISAKSSPFSLAHITRSLVWKTTFHFWTLLLWG